MRYLVTYILILWGSLVFAQDFIPDSPEVRNSTVEFNGSKYDGYVVEFNAEPDIVEEAIKERFKLQGIKAKETKGFMVYRNVVMSSIDPVNALDALIKIERKSRKEKDQTTVYLIAAQPGEITTEKSKSGDAAGSRAVGAVERGGSFLTSLIPEVRQGVYNKNLDNQQSIVKKEEKKLSNLADDLADMEKKLKKLQSDIEFNKKAQERQLTEVEKVKNSLNELISKNPSKGGL